MAASGSAAGKLWRPMRNAQHLYKVKRMQQEELRAEMRERRIRMTEAVGLNNSKTGTEVI